MSEPPSVTVALVCRNERDYIEQSLANLQHQQGMAGSYEIIVADGCSDDGTTEIVEAVARSDSRIRLIRNDGQIVPTGLNASIVAARGDIFVRADAHAEYAPDYVSNCVNALLASGADNVGGPQRTRAKGYFQAANAAAFRSPFSVGGARFHDPAFEGDVDTVVFGCWWRKRLIELGMFDEQLVRNQDDELNYRIRRAGGRIWQTPRIEAWYYPRANPGGLFWQYFQYGYWKVRLLRKHKVPTSMRQLAPVVALFLAAFLGLASIFSQAAFAILVALLGAYMICSVLASVQAAWRARRWSLLPVLPIVFGLYHLGYGLGYATGLYDACIGQDALRATASKLTK